jgi:hypothetical protein
MDLAALGLLLVTEVDPLPYALNFVARLEDWISRDECRSQPCGLYGEQPIMHLWDLLPCRQCGEILEGQRLEGVRRAGPKPLHNPP